MSVLGDSDGHNIGSEEQHDRSRDLDKRRDRNNEQPSNGDGSFSADTDEVVRRIGSDRWGDDEFDIHDYESKLIAWADGDQLHGYVTRGNNGGDQQFVSMWRDTDDDGAERDFIQRRHARGERELQLQRDGDRLGGGSVAEHERGDQLE